MDTVKEMLELHPQPVRFGNDNLLNCIRECLNCAKVCSSAADACLAVDIKQTSWLIGCITLTLDCADLCQAVGRILSRQTQTDWNILNNLLLTCAEVCRKTADENERHAKYHEFSRLCAESCRRCDQACTNLLADVPV